MAGVRGTDLRDAQGFVAVTHGPDAQYAEVVGATPAEARARIHGFPATPELCQRFLGIWEGLASEPGHRARAEETCCVRNGDPYCEILVLYEPD